MPGLFELLILLLWAGMLAGGIVLVVSHVRRRKRLPPDQRVSGGVLGLVLGIVLIAIPGLLLLLFIVAVLTVGQLGTP